MNQRLDGLDLARFLALGGMMLVNFRLAMHPPKGSAWLEAFFHFFEGKASATFVSLAGLGLPANRHGQRQHRHWRVPAGLIEPGGGIMDSRFQPAA